MTALFDSRRTSPSEPLSPLLRRRPLPEQTAPAPSDAPQFSEPQALAEQLESEDSEPVHATLSSQNEFCTLRRMGADVAEPRPSCLQTTVASFMPQ